MKKKRDPETRKLVRNIFIHKVDHSTNIAETGDLGTKSRLFVKESFDETAMVLSQDSTLSVCTKTTGFCDQFTCHVLSMQVLPLSSTADLYQKVTDETENNR